MADSTASVMGGKETAFDRSAGSFTKTGKRTTPEDDVDRLAERVWNRGRGKISNRTDYNNVYDSYMSDVGHSDKMKEKVFDRIKINHKSVSGKRGRNKARGKVFKQIATQPVRTKKQGIEYNTLALQGRRGKVVWAKKTRVTIRGKERLTLRNTRGQFVRAKKQ